MTKVLNKDITKMFCLLLEDLSPLWDGKKKTEYCQPLGTTKNAKISGCSWVVVTRENQTTVALF